MFKGKRIVAVVPARGGSKGLPRKNLKRIGSKTLVERALETARGTPSLDRVIVSSDSKMIIQLANGHGPFAPFVRPPDLARDESSSRSVFLHALNWAEEEDQCQYDYIVALEPTSPFRLPRHIEQGLGIALETMASSVVSLVEVADSHPIRVKKIQRDGRIHPYCFPEPEGLRRQDQDTAYIRNGAVLIFPRDTLIQERLWGDRPFGFVMERGLYGINIDEPGDLAAARTLYQKLKKEGKLSLIEAGMFVGAGNSRS